MKQQDKDRYLNQYEMEKRRGEPYFPRYALRDALVGIAVIVVLMLISAWFGAPLDEQADPLATDYVPRPEWYFFFIFQLLKYFSGEWEVVGIVVIPALAVLFLAILPFLDASRFRHFRRRRVVTGITGVLLVGALGLTLVAVIEAPPPADATVLAFAADSVGEEELYVSHCSACHGELGEGAANPSQPGDVIPPISTAEYLASRTDESIRTAVAEGLPEFGMSAFEDSHGGPLSALEIDSIVTHIRSWEADPPVQLDTAVSSAALSDNAEYLYPQLCAQCHGERAEGGIGPSLADAVFQDARTDEQIFDTINLGHSATSMIAWGEVLSQTQIQGLVAHIRAFGAPGQLGVPRYTLDVLPIFEVRCNACHGTSGGWDGTSWASAIESGNNAPVVIPGDAENSILAQMMAGTHPRGVLMPPDGKLPDALVQLVTDWIEGGALE